MKNTSEESFFKKKGFFIALYSTLGAVTVLALAITFTNLTGPSASNEPEPPGREESSVSVNTDDVETIDQLEAERELSDEQAWWRSTPKPQPATPQPTPAPPVAAPAPAPVTPPPVTPSTPPASPAPAADAGDTGGEATTGDDKTEDAAAETKLDETTAFTPFADDDKMVWPVVGEIVMAFSGDNLVYDPTLDQYKVHEEIRIAAKEGTPVKACADGQVLEVGSNHVYGTYVAIDHGNGWVSTYGQLMDGILVEQGEIVSAGQVIGGVAQPSFFGSLNGTHVNLRVTKDDEAVDPAALFAEEKE